MTVDPDDAAASLRDVASVERRMREAMAYARSSSILMYWGMLVVVGYLFNHVDPPHAGKAWAAIIGLGVIGTIGMRVQMKRAAGESLWDMRINYAMLVLVAYGIVWSIVLGPLGPREMGVFWPTLFMFGYIVAGLWLGHFFIYCGLAVTALTMVGYFWLGPWFYLWMAAVGGGGLIAGGIWLRRVGLKP
jgi:hypothetical protein